MDNSDDVELAESALGNPYFFTGREFDPESGLYYYRARYYDSQTGTFLQEDLVGGLVFRPTTLNKYSYVENDPVNRIDPTGNISIVEATLIAVLIAAGLTISSAISAGSNALRILILETRKRQIQLLLNQGCPLPGLQEKAQRELEQIEQKIETVKLKTPLEQILPGPTVSTDIEDPEIRQAIEDAGIDQIIPTPGGL